MKEIILKINGWMSCLDARGVEKKLLSKTGVHHVQANFMNGTATVHFDESQLTLADLEKFVASMDVIVVVSLSPSTWYMRSMEMQAWGIRCITPT